MALKRTRSDAVTHVVSARERSPPRPGNRARAVQAESAPAPTLDPVQLGAMLESTFNAPGYQPPLLPATAIQLLQITRQPDVTFTAVAVLLRKEPLIASQVLRLAQSPVYRRASPIRSLEHAARLLGLQTLSDLFLQAALTAQVFRVPGYEKPMSQLRDHSAATAIISRLVSQETPYSDDYAFLCGLLHDVGTAACVIALAESFGGGGQRKLPPLTQFWPVIGDMHEVASARLAQIWQLPPDVGLIIGHHHSLLWNGGIHPHAAVVCVADSIAAELGHPFESEIDGDQVLKAQAALQLTGDTLDRVRRSAERVLSAP